MSLQDEKNWLIKENLDSGSKQERYVSLLAELVKKDPQIKALIPDCSVMETARKPGLPYDKVIAAFLDGYADRPALGERNYEVIKSETKGTFIRNYLPGLKTITYRELHNRIKALSMAWRFHSECTVKRNDLLCIIGFAGLDFSIIDFACAYSKAIPVPLVSTMASSEIEEIITRTEPVVLASRIEDLPLCIELAIGQQTIKSLIVFNYDNRVDEERERVKQANKTLRESGTDTKLILLNDLINYGRGQTFSFLPEETAENEKTAMIIHSSGSTGKPKGACIAAKAVIYTWLWRNEGLPKVTVIISPFNHMMGRDEMYTTLSVGGTAYFTLKSDMSTLFEDIRLTRPVTLLFFPRVLELIYQYFQIEVARMLKSGENSQEAAELEVKARMKGFYLGDRLLSCVVASAPLAPRIKSFIRECFDIFLAEGYGNTEAGGGLAIDGKINRNIILEYKLRDVPDLGYFSSDKPFPRGEFCVKTKFGIKEYYKQPEATAALKDQYGYILTGDIVEEQSPDQIVIIDRIKDILKLSQGEYVALGRLGQIFESECAIINQIYLYGSSHRSYLLAVVVPEIMLSAKMLEGELTEGELKIIIKDELQRAGHKEGLKSFEIPRDFIIVTEPFSKENGLLSGVGKYLRPAIKIKYASALEAMYDEYENQQHEIVKDAIKTNSYEDIRETIIKLLEGVLGIKDFEKDKPRTFNELGGDSLGAALLSISIQDIFGVNIGGDVILSPTGNIQTWTSSIKEAQNHKYSGVSFSSIHGIKPQFIKADDLSLERFLPEILLSKAADLPTALHPTKTILLTGANGFLGHILCLKLMKKLSQRNGKLICIIRASDDLEAERRLSKDFIGIDSRFESEFRKLSAKYLEVWAGDISKPFLGLAANKFNQLAMETDRICHAAALVNHRLSYNDLFQTNVYGTAEIIRLALTCKKKTIDFISSISVNSFINSNNKHNETSPLNSTICPGNKYLGGYAVSKWAAECLLSRAYGKFDLPVNIFRCSMIMPDQNFRGQINVDDILTRLLYSIIITGLAPISFYIHGDNVLSGKNCHYDGIPVNVLSEIIAEVSCERQTIMRTFNARNYLKDEISLDTFVEWIEEAGYKLIRIDDFTQWNKMIGERLKLLPSEKRKYSIVDVMEAYKEPYPAFSAMNDCANFEILVKQLNKGEDIPAITKDYFYKYLNDMLILGLINPC